MKHINTTRRVTQMMVFVLGTLFASGYFLGCQKNDTPVTPNETQTLLLAEPDMATVPSPPDYNDPALVPPPYNEADYDNNNEEMEGDHDFESERGWHRGFHLRPLIRFGKIAHRLDLSREQRDSTKLFLKEYRECVRFTLDSLHRSEKTILRAYHARIDSIHHEVKDSVITRDSGRVLLRQARRQLEQDLKNNPVRAWAIEHLKMCRDEFVKKFESILTPAQLEKWKKMKEHFQQQGFKEDDGDNNDGEHDDGQKDH